MVTTGITGRVLPLSIRVIAVVPLMRLRARVMFKYPTFPLGPDTDTLRIGVIELIVYVVLDRMLTGLVTTLRKLATTVPLPATFNVAWLPEIPVKETLFDHDQPEKVLLTAGIANIPYAPNVRDVVSPSTKQSLATAMQPVPTG